MPFLNCRNEPGRARMTSSLMRLVHACCPAPNLSYRPVTSAGLSSARCVRHLSSFGGKYGTKSTESGRSHPYPHGFPRNLCVPRYKNLLARDLHPAGSDPRSLRLPTAESRGIRNYAVDPSHSRFLLPALKSINEMQHTPALQFAV